MIGSLRGRLLARSGAGELLIEVHGIGYWVRATAPTAAAAGPVGSEAFVHVHHVVREDAELLYGFATDDERRTFEALLRAHRVGPALALAILDVHRPEALRRAVAFDDVDALRLVPGVGPKTAVRLLVELKSKLDLPEAEAPPEAGAGQPQPGASALDDVRSALTGLGYSAEEIRQATAELPADGEAEDLIRQALLFMAGGRSHRRPGPRSAQG